MYEKAYEYCDSRWMEKYVNVVQQHVPSYLLNITDEDLKNEDKKVVADILGYLNVLTIHNTSSTAVNLDLLKLEIAFKFLKCPFLEKRIQGLNDIREIINSVLARKSIYHHSSLLSSSTYDVETNALDSEYIQHNTTQHSLLYLQLSPH